MIRIIMIMNMARAMFCMMSVTVFFMAIILTRSMIMTVTVNMIHNFLW